MFKLLNKKKNNKGFTLVELVIVIAILAILVGLLAPQYTKYVEKSRKSADASNMDEMVEAALKEFAPDYSKVKLKSKQWGDTNPTATITVDKDGGVKVSYEPEAFATFMDKKSK